MPNKTIYVADADLPLFERAASIAGGLSPAVTAAIKLYVRREGKTHMPATQIIELDVTENGLTRRQRFRGRTLISITQRHDLRVVRYSVYVTAKEQFAVYRRDEPDWSRMAPDNTATWSDPRTWDDDFYDEDRTLQVFPDIAAMRTALPDDVVDAIAEAQARPAVDDLDI